MQARQSSGIGLLGNKLHVLCNVLRNSATRDGVETPSWNSIRISSLDLKYLSVHNALAKHFSTKTRPKLHAAQGEQFLHKDKNLILAQYPQF